MKMKIFWLIILPTFFFTWPENTTAEVEPRTLPTLIPLIGSIISAVNSIINRQSSASDDEKTILEDLITISSKVTESEHILTETSDTTISKILHAFPQIVNLELNMHELNLIINQINYAEEKMKKYLILTYNEIKSNQANVETLLTLNQNSSQSGINNMSSATTETVTALNTATTTTTPTKEAGINTRIEKYTLENFATWATDNSFNSMASLLKRLNDLVIIKNDEGIFDIILQVSKDSHNSICTLKQSLHQTLYNLYNAIIIAELKGNTVLQISYKILKMYGKGTFSDEAKLALRDYETYAKQKLEVARIALSVADRAVYKCDPNKYVDGVTYTKLTNLLRAYVENEVNLNPKRSCWKTCGFYKNTRQYGCHKRKELCSHQPLCKGRIVHCRSLSKKMQVCFSSTPERRYDWITYSLGRVLGSGGKVCKKGTFLAHSWLARFFSRCSYCVCFCDDVGRYSDRYFNLREVTSDIDQNKVVTGLRIVKKNQIIHIQIQQGLLTPHGFINRTSLSWKPVDNYTIHDHNVKNNVDYYTMSLTRRIIDTNEMVGPSEHVVTGLRFRIIGTHLNLEARVTPMNFTSGELYQNKTFWLGNYTNGVNEKHGINEIELIKPDVPIRRGPHTLISQFYEYIKFQPTSLKYDVGQSTVPYLDSQELTSDGFALSGIGLIHRGKRHSGGFIAPKLISYDFTSHLSFIKTN